MHFQVITKLLFCEMLFELQCPELPVCKMRQEQGVVIRPPRTVQVHLAQKLLEAGQQKLLLLLCETTQGPQHTEEKELALLHRRCLHLRCGQMALPYL